MLPEIAPRRFQTRFGVAFSSLRATSSFPHGYVPQPTLADVEKTHSVAPAGNTGARVRVAEEPNDDTGLKPAPGSLPSPCQNEYVRVVPEDLRLAGVLETVLYYASDQQDEMERFYEMIFTAPAAVSLSAAPQTARRDSAAVKEALGGRAEPRLTLGHLEDLRKLAA